MVQNNNFHKNSFEKQNEIKKKIMNQILKEKKRDRYTLLSKIQNNNYIVPNNNISKFIDSNSNISMRNFDIQGFEDQKNENPIIESDLNYSAINFKEENLNMQKQQMAFHLSKGKVKNLDRIVELIFRICNQI